MLLYLDSNLVQYYADYQSIIFENEDAFQINQPLLVELKALQKIIELEQLGEGWQVAAPKHLLDELQYKKPNVEQKEVYSILLQAWQKAGQQEANETSEENIFAIGCSLSFLKLKDKDSRHLAEAIALGAVWFLTNDKRLINHTRPKKDKKSICKIQGIFIARPSECIPELTRGLFL